MAIFFSAATAAGAFGGLFAYGIMKLDGERGILAWRWIFIVSYHPVWSTLLFLRKHLVLLQS
jgi:MFS family permease